MQKYGHDYWMDADERYADRPERSAWPETPREIEIDTLPFPVAVYSFTAERCPAEPEIGIFRAYVSVNGAIESWRVGNLTLTRAQLVQAIGETEVERIEEREAEEIEREMTE